LIKEIAILLWEGLPMISCEPEKLFTMIPGFENASTNVARAIHNTVTKREAAREIADLLHGVWLKHPLHPGLTDFVIGAWVFGSVLDGAGLMSRSKGLDKAADLLISVGNAAALPTAMSGLADFSTAPKRSMKTGASHALLNVGGLALNLVSSFQRRSGKRNAARTLSAAASGLLLVSAWLGGKLVYDQKVGVSKIPQTGKNEPNWKTAISESDLPESVPKRVDIGEAPVLLCRSGAQINAIGAVCGHEGGPLEEGELQGHHITCPWHQSVFDLRDGRVIHGPSTYPEPAYECRTQNGYVEIRPK
jgi:nitrite reductase/ring-hydroxylating ferredoxin subunit/uncharacterized membrane protein